MSDVEKREKVMRGLMDISDYFFEIYRRSNEREEFELALDRHNIIEDALALLREQEERIKFLEKWTAYLEGGDPYEGKGVLSHD